MIKQSILIILHLLQIHSLEVTGPQILYVSDSPSGTSRSATTSLNGGRMIYIKAIGHDPMPTGNSINVGSFPCIIPADGVTDTFISCETTNSYSAVDILNLRVTLISYGIMTVSSIIDVVNYRNVKTPILS